MDLTLRLQTLLGPRHRRIQLIALTTPVLAWTAYRIVSTLTSISSSRRAAKILASPRKSLQLLSAQSPDSIPYPDDALPGARDVDTPYGNIRVYEWGPTTGRKVLFIHGISTPCIAFARLAQMMVEKMGCRVMLFDLFGRGYSDTPDPAVYHQDIQLWTTQILLVLTSSQLAWTKPARFALVGYSMGGGIAAAFTSYFPEMVESLVLVAPGGLIRPNRISWSSKLLYGNLLPQSLVNYFIYRRLKGGTGVHPASGVKSTTSNKPTAPAEAAESEIPHPALAANSVAPIFSDRPRISPQNTVSWQADAHAGFLPAFISSIRHAPIGNEHGRWRLIGSRQEARRTSAKSGTTLQEGQNLKEGKVLVLLGEQDGVIIADEIEEDAVNVLGETNTKVVRLQGGHDLPIVNAMGCMEAIEKFWQNNN